MRKAIATMLWAAPIAAITLAAPARLQAACDYCPPGPFYLGYEYGDQYFGGLSGPVMYGSESGYGYANPPYYYVPRYYYPRYRVAYDHRAYRVKRPAYRVKRGYDR